MFMNEKKLLKKILDGSKNIKFNDFIRLVEAFGFHLDRINGSHHIFKKDEIDELINLQNVNDEVKPYQIKQFLTVIEKYNLSLEGDR
jgi:predicted RNA binding protein YcfA (HicA-like mRNA interferase family)